MPTRIDYYVTAVSFNVHKTHIDWLRCRKNEGSTWGAEQDFTRQSVIDAINKGTNFFTVTKNAKGGNDLGQQLFAYTMQTHFLKTRSDSSTKDDLDNLPTF